MLLALFTLLGRLVHNFGPFTLNALGTCASLLTYGTYYFKVHEIVYDLDLFQTHLLGSLR